MHFFEAAYGIMASMTHEQLKNAAASVAAKYGITRVTLFGSRASGECRVDSDVDLIA